MAQLRPNSAMLIGLDHRLDEDIAQRGESEPDGNAAERHGFQDRPQLRERGLENAVGEIDVPRLDLPAKHQIAGLVGQVPEQRIGQRIADKGPENGGNDTAADDPGDQRRHDHVGAEKGRERREGAGGKAERHSVGRIAQAAKAMDDVAARAAPAAAGPQMHPHPLQKALRLAAPEQHHHLENRTPTNSQTTVALWRPCIFRLSPLRQPAS